MKHSAIEKTIKKQFKKVQAAYYVMQTSGSADAVHRFRVSIKHVRAFTRMLQTASKKSPAIPRKLKKLYAQSGIVRNWQLFIQTFSRNRTLKRYAERRLETAAADMQQMMTENLVSNAAAKMLKRLPDRFTKKEIQDFRHQKIKAIGKLADQPKPRDEQLHSIRKGLKDLQYDKLLASKPAKKKYYKKLSEKLGSLQDCRIELQLLEEINQQQPSTKIQKLLNSNAGKKERLVKQITRTLNSQAI